MRLSLDFKDILTYGSFIVSLTVAYYTHEVRIVKLESEAQQDRKVIQEVKDELKEIKADIKQLLIKVKWGNYEIWSKWILQTNSRKD